jgi:hypothetical protein
MPRSVAHPPRDLQRLIAADRASLRCFDEMIKAARDPNVKRALRSGAAHVQRRLDALLAEQTVDDLRRDFKVRQMAEGDR